MYKAIFSGFQSKEQAQAFLDWFEGQGEQCEGLAIYFENIDSKPPMANCPMNVIDHPDGLEMGVRF